MARARPWPWRSRRALHRRLAPETTTWPGALSLADCADLAGLGRRFRGDCRGGFEIEAEQRRHRALADRHRLLHRLRRAAAAAAPHRAMREGAGGASAEYSPSEWPATKAASRARSRPRFRLAAPAAPRATRHQGGLGVRGERQLVFRPFEHQARRASATSASSTLLEDGARRRRSSRQAPCPCRPPGCPGRER